MLYKPKNALNTNKVSITKTSQLLHKTNVKVNLQKINVPAVIQKNTREKTALIRRRFDVSAKIKGHI